MISLQGKAQGVAYGVSGLIVMLVYALFLVIDLVHPMPSNKWFYFTLLIAVFALIPLYKGKRLEKKAREKSI